ncbi:MAG TPA: hypothetical protein VFW87_03020 [Pirellulales bacterium]|nr:hypothetical protein [Pirellulales bacterium]
MRISAIFLVLAIAAGCGDMGGPRRKASGSAAGTGLVGADAATSTAPVQPAPAQTQSAPAPPAGQQSAMPGGGQSGGLPGLPGVQLPGQSPAGSPGTVTVSAQPGVTGKGNYGPGLIATPISVYFQAQERLVFDQVVHALRLYDAEHGSKPKTEEEFMTKIIQANNIRLPKLPEGSKYKYDSQKGELLVEHPQ